MSEIICDCGHGIEEHNLYGCTRCDEDCYLSVQTVEARHQLKQVTAEKDVLQKQLEVAKKGLRHYTIVDDFTMSHYAINALAEIDKIGEKHE